MANRKLGKQREPQSVLLRLGQKPPHQQALKLAGIKLPTTRPDYQTYQQLIQHIKTHPELVLFNMALRWDSMRSHCEEELEFFLQCVREKQDMHDQNERWEWIWTHLETFPKLQGRAIVAQRLFGAEKTWQSQIVKHTLVHQKPTAEELLNRWNTSILETKDLEEQIEIARAAKTMAQTYNRPIPNNCIAHLI